MNTIDKIMEELKEPNRTLTDLGNAELFVEQYKDRLLFDHKRGRWLLWKGHIWKPDQEEEIISFSMDFIKKMGIDAWEIKDEGKRSALASWAIRCQTKERIVKIPFLAKAILPIRNNGENFDKNTMLLSCKNGIVDLKTGELRNGKQTDWI